jgi:cation transport ATPase
MRLSIMQWAAPRRRSRRWRSCARNRDRRRGGQTSEIPVEQMVGDIAIVRPNERLPADGFVIKGTSDQPGPGHG